MSQPDYENDLVFPPKSSEWQIKAKAVLDLCKPQYQYIAMDENKQWSVFTGNPHIEEDTSGFWAYDNKDILLTSGDFGFGFCQEGDCFDIPPADNWKTSLIERS